MPRLILRCTAAAAALAILSVAPRDSLGQVPLVRTVALTGQFIPGANVELTNLAEPVLNVKGQTAFTAYEYFESTDSVVRSIWSEGGGTLEQVARTGGGANMPEEFTFFRELQINAAGQVAFQASLTLVEGTRFYRQGVWLASEGGLMEVASTGHPAHVPDVPTSVNHTFQGVRLNDGGQLAYIGTHDEPAYFPIVRGHRSIWIKDTGNVRVLASSTWSEPDLKANEWLDGFQQLSMNDHESLAFSAWIDSVEIDQEVQRSIWRYRGEGLELIARENEPVPDGSGVFAHLSSPVLNNSDLVVFSAETVAASAQSRRGGIWANDGNATYPIVQVGDLALGTGGRAFAGMAEATLNDAGEIAFVGGVYTLPNYSGGPVNTGVWRIGAATSRIVAREGDVAPGTNVMFDYFDEQLALNAAGQVAFEAELRGINGTRMGYGLWALDRSDQLRLIARTGGALEVAPGDLRTINQLTFLAKGFNDRGQLAFRAAFTDGSMGVFVSNVAAIPEPGTLYLALAGLSMLLAKKRCRGMPR